MDWTRDLPSWPLHHLSRQVRCQPHLWHVQECGSGPTILLLHGAGASTHSWRDLIPRLARDHHVVALDLPGQGFTRLGTRQRCGLDGMSEDIARLCTDQRWRPALVVGHSAGGVIALNLAQLLPETPAIVGINAALGRFDGMAGWLFPMLARLLALAPFAARLFATGRPNPARARRLIESTGSNLTLEGFGYYARLLADQGHVDATLQMMAQWNVDGLLNRLDTVTANCLLLTGDKDLAVSPETSRRVSARMPNATHVSVEGVGHLAHEERPEEFSDRILAWFHSLD